ncbi:MAG: tripartite tricarboxylate transporter substrate-binding protein, partial [Achromobacter sp.]
DFMFATIPSVIGQIRAGKLRPLAVSTLQRSTTLPELPTIAESGYPGFDAGSWFGFFAPKGTPPAVVDTINREVNAALPALQAQMLNEGAEPVGGTPAQFAAFIRQEHDKWAALVRKFEPSAN